MSAWELIVAGASYLYRASFAKWTETSFLVNVGFFPAVALLDLITGRRLIKWSRKLLASVGSSVTIFVLNGIFFPVLFIGAEKFQALYDRLHVPHVPRAFWDSMPAWVVGLVTLLAFDFANYWNHRWMHWRWIWPIHAIHHSDPVVAAPTTLRVHVLELVFMSCSYVVLLGWLGLPAGAIGLGRIFLILHNQYVHIDVDWTHGPLRHVIASPRFHRWHHADFKPAYGKNLANLFPFFDVLFGTYVELGPCRERMGAKGVPENDVVQLMLFPFKEWGRMLAELVRPKKEPEPEPALVPIETRREDRR